MRVMPELSEGKQSGFRKMENVRNDHRLVPSAYGQRSQRIPAESFLGRFPADPLTVLPDR